MDKSNFNIAIEVLTDKVKLWSFFKIAIIVGTILNFINQGDVLLQFDFESVSFTKILITYLVPFMVSSYTAISMKINFTVGEVSIRNANLTCKICKESISVKKDELIPMCKLCKDKTIWKSV